MNNFEEKIKNELESNHLDYNETYWQNMSEILDKKSPNKKPIYYAVVSLSALCLISLFAYYFTDKDLSLNSANKSVLHSHTRQLDLAKINVVSKSNQIKNNKEIKQISSIISDNKLSQKVEKIKVNNNVIALSNSLTTLSNSSSMYEEFFEPKLIDITITSDNEELKLSKNQLIKKILGFNTEIIDSVNIIFKKKQNIPIVRFAHFISPYARYNINSKPEFTDQELLNYKNNEVFKNTYSYGINYLIKKQNILAGVGVSFNQMKIKTNYTTKVNNYQYDTTLKLLNPNFGKTAGGTRIALLYKDVDTTVTQSVKTLNPNNELKVSFIQIPLFTQYHFRVKKMNLFCEMGINLMYMTKIKGEYVNKINGAYVIENQTQNNAFNKTTTSYHIGAGFKYPIYKNIGIFTSYQYNSWMNSSIENYKQKPIQKSFTLGLEIAL